MSLDVLIWFIVVLFSYLIGGIPTAFVVTRLATGRDIRQLGDRNSGAANVFRNVGPRAGFLVGAIDIGKGALSVLLVWSLIGSTALQMTAGVAVLAGHNWPAHFGFRGGRGAAPAIGVLLATAPIVALPIGAFALMALYVSKKAIIGLAVVLIFVPILAWPAAYDYRIAVYAVCISLMVGVSHFISVGGLSLRGLVHEQDLDPEQSDERIVPQG